jgi:predicted O-methyltransferase YrrM
MPDVDGWLTPAEGAALAELARGLRVLEVGSYLGLSTVCLARTAQMVVAADPHDGRGTPAPGDTCSRFDANLRRHGVRHKVRTLTGTFAEVADRLASYGKYHLIYIDGAHDLASVADDVARALPLLGPDGLLVFHDYRSVPDPGVTLAVDALVARGARLVKTVDSLAVVRPSPEMTGAASPPSSTSPAPQLQLLESRP